MNEQEFVKSIEEAQTIEEVWEVASKAGMDKASFEQLLQPLLNEKTSWTPMAQDLLAMSAIKNGDIETVYEWGDEKYIDGEKSLFPLSEFNHKEWEILKTE